MTVDHQIGRRDLAHLLRRMRRQARRCGMSPFDRGMAAGYRLAASMLWDEIRLLRIGRSAVRRHP